ncbi:MAG: hypothetical protein M3Q36_01155 [bacterium]|nr:hypothetical protein [bacterium]
MTLIHEAGPVVQEQILDEFPAPFGNQKIVVLGPNDYRVPTAMEIEKYNMMLLGDPEELVDIDLPKDLEEARFMAVFPVNEVPDADNMLGVVRVTSVNPIDGTIKSFREAAEVTGDDYEKVYQHFVDQTGQTDPAKIYDINTYGMSEAVWTEAGQGNSSLFQAVKYNLMFAMTHEGIRLLDEEGYTHSTAYFNALSWGYFLSKGFDWERLNGYEPQQDQLQKGDEVLLGQALIPTVLDMEKHKQRMLAAVTPFLGELAVSVLGVRSHTQITN